METAWHLLTPNAPYAATVNTEETLKAVVLLTAASAFGIVRDSLSRNMFISQ